jgi:hypothetical protein
MSKRPLLLAVATWVGLDCAEIARGHSYVDLTNLSPSAIGEADGDLILGFFGGAVRFSPGGTQIMGYSVPSFEAPPDDIEVLGSSLWFGTAGDDSPGTLYQFDLASGALLQAIESPSPPIADDRFGYSLAVVGTDLLVGAPGEDGDAGAAYLIDSATGAAPLTLTSPAPLPNGEFGAAVANVAGDLLVGEPGEEKAHLYTSGGAFLLTLSNPGAGTLFGLAVAGIDGDLLVGSTEAAYRFDRSSGTLLQTYPGGATVLAVRGTDILMSGGKSPSTAERLPARWYDGSTGALLKSYPFRPGALRHVGGITAVGDFLFCGGLAGCAACETCDDSGGCELAPNPSCQPPSGGAARKSTIKLVRSSNPRRHRLTWKIPRTTQGAAGIAGFGDPLDTTDYAVCLFDGAGNATSFVAPAGSTCDGRPCWRAFEQTRQVEYRDPDAAGDGLKSLRFIAGQFQGETRIQVQGKGENLDLPAPPLTGPVTMQIQGRDWECWEARFSSPKRNSDGVFSASSD